MLIINIVLIHLPNRTYYWMITVTEVGWYIGAFHATWIITSPHNIISPIARTDRLTGSSRGWERLVFETEPRVRQTTASPIGRQRPRLTFVRAIGEQHKNPIMLISLLQWSLGPTVPKMEDWSVGYSKQTRNLDCHLWAPDSYQTAALLLFCIWRLMGLYQCLGIRQIMGRKMLKTIDPHTAYSAIELRVWNHTLVSFRIFFESSILLSHLRSSVSCANKLELSLWKVWALHGFLLLNLMA